LNADRIQALLYGTPLGGFR